MKLNRTVLAAAALVVGSLSVMACSKSDDDVSTEPAGTEQASAMEESTQTAGNEGTEDYARWGHHGGHGLRGGVAHAGWRRGDRDRGRRGWGRGRDHDRDGRRGWWHRFW
jgi:hypothetical protein